MSERTPYHFRPMDELQHEDMVELALRTGQVVYGRLMKGITTPASRSFFATVRGEQQRVEPIGWRDIPTPSAIQAWKELTAA